VSWQREPYSKQPVTSGGSAAPPRLAAPVARDFPFSKIRSRSHVVSDPLSLGRADPIPLTDAVPDRALKSDVLHSVKNAATLGVSLVLTWAVALGVRILLPRYFGPAAFGVFQFADAFTATLFILTSLGLETYVRKEVATRPDHASSFFGGILVVRLALSILLLAVAVLALAAGGKAPGVLKLVIVLGIAQILMTLNGTYAALLHAAAVVGGLSVLNVATKVAWGIGVILVFFFHGGLQAVGVALLLSEIVRTIGLARLARRELHLRISLDVRATTGVIVAALPFFLAQIAQTVYAKIDISIMSFITNDTEVGWYGAASNLAGLSMLLSPLIGWVLLPLTSRALARSQDELTLVTRRAMELILITAIPITLFLALGADVIVDIVFGAPFAPAARSLRVLAPMFVLTYAAIVSASILVRLERGWAVTFISISGMVVTPLLDLLLIPRFVAAFGRGGGGIGAATALMITEIYTTVILTWLLGDRAFDRRSVVVLYKTLAICGVVVLLNYVLSPLRGWRLLVDGAVYIFLVVAWKAADLRALRLLIAAAVRSKTPPLAIETT
jgi:O-antigen/teichoic acid export membrane protein